MNNLTSILNQERRFFTIISNILKEQAVGITREGSPDDYLFKNRRNCWKYIILLLKIIFSIFICSWDFHMYVCMLVSMHVCF